MTASELQLLGLSLRVALVATLMGLPFALAAGWFLARSRTRARLVVDVLVTLPLVLPPVVSGYALLVLLGPDGPLGINLVFTWVAASLAAAVITFPLVVRAMEIAFAGVDRRLEQVARSLGAGPWRTFLTVTVPLASRGLLGGVLLGFIRGLGEFGATIVVAGNIPGRTQTLPLAIFTSLETGKEETLLRLVLLSIGLALVTLVVHALLVSRRPA